MHVSGRKLAGILAEGAVSHVVLGIGINVQSAAYPADVAARATSIEAELGRPVDRGLVLAECLAALGVALSRTAGRPWAARGRCMAQSRGAMLGRARRVGVGRETTGRSGREHRRRRRIDREGGRRDAEDQVGRSQVVVEPADQYCRAIEAYLCRKNDGHLIRIVGPAFEQVLGWATKGVPIKIACHGIDRYFERYYAKGPRRRPVRIEFCEADVLDAFDEWRRAVGIASESGSLLPARAVAESSEASSRRHESLPAHLDRVIARLTTLRAGADRSLDDAIDAVIRELDGAANRGQGSSRGSAPRARRSVEGDRCRTAGRGRAPV